ncbi:MAG TPA: transglycosylase SLT domain-containing protein [Candidatus Acidoferrum sp.]|nr:transglycosylase SLT domain-containing protein [Candidatus Acidoferrum sp.]
MKPIGTAQASLQPQTSLERLKGQRAPTLEAEKARLKKATKEFEAFFNYYMLKTMRQTIPKDEMAQNLPLGDDMGKETFSDIFDMEVSHLMSSKGQRSISDLLYKSMVKIVETQYEKPAATDKNVETEGSKKQTPIPLPMKAHRTPIALPKTTYKIQTHAAPSVPATKVSESGSHDSILQKFGQHIDEAARKNDLDSSLIVSVIRAESGGNEKAVSKAGAKGLMQLVDSTAQDYGVKNSFDPEENIHAGSRFLKHLLDRYKDLGLALAAYNAGPANVDKYGGIPPFKETQDFVTKVKGFIERAAGAISGTPAKEQKASVDTKDAGIGTPTDRI